MNGHSSAQLLKGRCFQQITSCRIRINIWYMFKIFLLRPRRKYEHISCSRWMKWMMKGDRPFSCSCWLSEASGWVSVPLLQKDGALGKPHSLWHSLQKTLLRHLGSNALRYTLSEGFPCFSVTASTVAAAHRKMLQMASWNNLQQANIKTIPNTKNLHLTWALGDNTARAQVPGALRTLKAEMAARSAVPPAVLHKHPAATASCFPHAM